MRNISLFRDTAISHSNIDIRIVTKNIAIHRCTGVSLQPYFRLQLYLFVFALDENTCALYMYVCKVHVFAV